MPPLSFSEVEFYLYVSRPFNLIWNVVGIFGPALLVLGFALLAVEAVFRAAGRILAA